MRILIDNAGRRLWWPVLGAVRVAVLPLVTAFGAVSVPEIAHGEIKLIEASGRYQMGDNDTKLQARRLAELEAKRNALERAGTYLESVTAVRNLQLTYDRVRAYAGGILEVVESRERWDVSGQTMAVTVSVKVRIDTDDVARKVEALRSNGAASQMVEISRQNIQEEERRIAMLNDQLKSAKGANVAGVVESRENALSRIRAAELVARAGSTMAAWRDRSGAILQGSVPRDTIVRARQDVEEAMRLDPQNDRALLLMGLLLQETGDYGEADRYLRQVLAKEPNDLHALAGLAFGLGEQERFDEAIPVGLRLVHLYPGSSNAHHIMGNLYLDSGDTRAAIPQYREAIRINPEDRASYNNLGSALLEAGDPQGAQQALDQACRLGSRRACQNLTVVRSPVFRAAQLAGCASTRRASQPARASYDGFLLLLAFASWAAKRARCRRRHR